MKKKDFYWIQKLNWWMSKEIFAEKNWKCLWESNKKCVKLRRKYIRVIQILPISRFSREKRKRWYWKNSFKVLILKLNKRSVVVIFPIIKYGSRRNFWKLGNLPFIR